MLTAYVRRQNGDTRKIDWKATGQYLTVKGGKVRMAHLSWAAEGIGGFTAETDVARQLLMETAALMDVLILTRSNALFGESVIFHGLVSECGGDGATINLVAVDDPDMERLFEQVFTPGPLRRSDQSDPAPAPAQALEGSFPAGAVPVGAPAQGGAQGGEVRTFTAVRALNDPAARPPARPAGQPGWVPAGNGTRG
jgi:hypothetical protein